MGLFVLADEMQFPALLPNHPENLRPLLPFYIAGTGKLTSRMAEITAASFTLA